MWRQDWVVHSKAVGDGRASLKYLAPYVFRVAISDRRIVACEDGQVTFSYRRSGSNRWRKMTVDAFEFIRRFLQHVLPSGFQKVRHYGFLSPNSRVSIEMVLWLVTLHNGLIQVLRAVSRCGDPTPSRRSVVPPAAARCACSAFCRLPAPPTSIRVSDGHRSHGPCVGTTSLRAFEVRGRCALGASNHGPGAVLPATNSVSIPAPTGSTSADNHSRPPIPTAAEPTAARVGGTPQRTVTLTRTRPRVRRRAS